MKQLYDLQELDWNISAEEQSLADVRARLADDSAVVAARADIQRLVTELSTRAPVRQQVESVIQDLAEKIQTIEGKLYSGAITNPRELSAYETERNLFGGRRDTEENGLLELMMEMDDLESARQRTQAQLTQLEADREIEHAELLKQEERLTRSLEELRRERADAASQAPPPALAMYETLRGSLGGHAVAKVERRMCLGCRLALPTMELQRARTSHGIIQCSSCRRILYIE